MRNATLSYYVKDKSFSIFSDMLFNIDRYTSSLNNERELFDNLSNNDAFQDFLKENRTRGSFKVEYKDNRNNSRLLPVLYNERPIEIDDIYEKGIISESEYARRSLLNSKEQLYSKLFILNNGLDKAKKYNVIVSDEEARLLNKCGIPTFTLGYSKAVSIEDLIRYRSSHSKLKSVRNIYVDALELWKAKMDDLPYDDIYYLSREYRVINKYYNKIIENGLSVSNLNIKKNNLGVLRNRVRLKTISPLVFNVKRKKDKIINKYSYAS